MATIDKIVLEISSIDSKALGILEKFYNEQPFEEDLRMDYLSWKSLILLHIDKPSESLLVLNDLLSVINDQDHRYTNALFIKTSALIKNHRINEAENIILKGLVVSEKKVFQKLVFLQLLLKIEDYNRTIPQKFTSHVDSLINEMGIPVNQENNYFEKLEMIVKMNLESNKKYSNLIAEISKDIDNLAKKNLVLEFIKSEKIRFYQRMGQDSLDNLDN